MEMRIILRLLLQNGHADVKEEEVEPEKTGLASIIDLTLFKSMTFNVICLSGFITFLGFFVPFMFLAGRYHSASILLNQDCVCSLEWNHISGILFRNLA